MVGHPRKAKLLKCGRLLQNGYNTKRGQTMALKTRGSSADQQDRCRQTEFSSIEH